MSNIKWDVIHGDCLDVMRGMPDASVDAVVTDPPYGVNFRGAAWDAAIPDWLGEARRVSRGPVAFTCGTLNPWDYPRPDWVLSWHRPGSNSRSMSGGFSAWSPILVYGKGKWPVDFYMYPAMMAGNENLGIPHPCPKPVSLMRWLVRGACEKGGLVLDPFTGSGTTGIAALDEGCRFVGIELDADHAALARSRIEAAARAPMLDFGGAS